jgi:hypothetical protein
MLLADHAQVGPLRVGVGEDHLGFEGAAVEEANTPSRVRTAGKEHIPARLGSWLKLSGLPLRS